MCTWLVTSVTKSNVLRHLVVGGKDFCFSHSTTRAWLLSAAQCKRVGTQGGGSWEGRGREGGGQG